MLFCLHSISCWLWGCMYVYSCVILCVFSCWLVYYSVCIVLLISVLFKCIFLLTCVILLFCSPSMYCWLLCCLNVSSCWLLYSFACVFLSTCVFFCMYFLRSFCAVSYVQYLLLTLILLICIVDFCVFLDDFYVVTDLFFWCKMSALQRITYPGIGPCSLDVFPIKIKYIINCGICRWPVIWPTETCLCVKSRWDSFMCCVPGCNVSCAAGWVICSEGEV